MIKQKMMTSHPPRGVKDGGEWGSVKYGGEKTQLCCLVLCLLGGIFTGCGTCAYLCPQDEKDGYRLGNKIYDSNGKLLGSSANVRFTAHGGYMRSLPPSGAPAPKQSAAPRTSNCTSNGTSARTSTRTTVTHEPDGSKKTEMVTINADGRKSIKTTIEKV